MTRIEKSEYGMNFISYYALHFIRQNDIKVNNVKFCVGTATIISKNTMLNFTDITLLFLKNLH